ncbi:neo-calmodulin-like [Babylonia areolata]|uniref:neo-calmodulin-like n=1 Tax=Babylonia areolata TaxID=304850 RepID=UPI003FD5F0BC
MAKPMCQVLLAIVCVFAIAPAFTQANGGNQEAAWRLELQPLGAVSNHRSRRHAFPGSGMPCLTVSFLTELKSRFNDRIDPNDDGKATASEVRQYLSKFNPQVSDEQVQSFIRKRDLNGNGIIEFVPEYIMDILSPDLTSDSAEEWFQLEDTDDDGFVSREELMSIAQRLGMSDEQAEESVASYYMSVDEDGDDRLSFDEYRVLYQK